jgi:hypothetical protein
LEEERENFASIFAAALGVNSGLDKDMKNGFSAEIGSMLLDVDSRPKFGEIEPFFSQTVESINWVTTRKGNGVFAEAANRTINLFNEEAIKGAFNEFGII